jgi:hypothetical protein
LWDKSVQPVVDIDVIGFPAHVFEYKLCNSVIGARPVDPPRVTNNLMFSNELNFWLPSELPRRGSKDINYYPYLNQILNDTARLYNIEAVISTAKLSQITAASFLKIQDRWFQINTMNLDTLTGKVKFELIHYFVEIQPPTLDLLPPIDLVATNIAINNFDLSWTADPLAQNVTGYNVYENGSFYRDVGLVLTENIGILTPGYGALWSLKSYNAGGQLSNESESIFVETLTP